MNNTVQNSTPSQPTTTPQASNPSVAVSSSTTSKPLVIAQSSKGVGAKIYSSKQRSQQNRARFMKRSSGSGNSSAATKQNGKSRFAQKQRNKKRPLAPVTKRTAPALEYISQCCGLPSRKPATGRKDTVINPENHKPKEESKGLGKWTCSGCGKKTKVTPRKPQPQEVAVVQPQSEAPVVG